MTDVKKTITLTFGDRAENNIGMQQIGQLAEKGFSCKKLKKIAKKYETISELVNLKKFLLDDTKAKSASVLILRGGVDHLFGDGFADKMLEEQDSLTPDKKAFMRGRVVNKLARWNLCFSQDAQEPDYENKKGTIIALDSVPHLKRFRRRLPKFFGHLAKRLQVEGNYYYDVTKCGVGFHGDAERKIVIAVRLGDTIPLHYQWFKDNKSVGKRCELSISHGDIYIMSEKASGFDWKKRSIYTLRHAAGAKKYLTILPNPKGKTLPPQKTFPLQEIPPRLKKLSPQEFMRKDRIRGMLECLALGDAFGAPYELKNSKNPKTFNGTFEHALIRTNRFQGTRHGVIGQVTDDTEKALTLAASLIRNDGFSRSDVILSYEKWAGEAHFMGRMTRKLFKGVKTIKGYEGRVRKYKDEMVENESNGALMSCCSLACLNNDNLLEIVAEECSLSNPSPLNVVVNVLYVYTLVRIIDGGIAEEIYDDLRIKVREKREQASTKIKEIGKYKPRISLPKNLDYSLVKRVFKDVRSIGYDPDDPIVPLRDLTQNKGWALHGFYCAMFILKFYHHYVVCARADGVRGMMTKIIQMGGDTDTNCAIAGAVIGAIVGHCTLEEEMGPELKILYECDTSQGDYAMPAREGLNNAYHPRDIPFLVEELYQHNLRRHCV